MCEQSEGGTSFDLQQEIATILEHQGCSAYGFGRRCNMYIFPRDLVEDGDSISCRYRLSCMRGKHLVAASRVSVDAKCVHAEYPGGSLTWRHSGDRAV